MTKKFYMETKNNTLESAILDVWKNAAENNMSGEQSYELGTDRYREHTQSMTPGQQVEEEVVVETNKNDKSDDGDGLDAVQPKAVKKKFDDRKDKDIDNDGDSDDSDEFLHKKRKAISKAIKSDNKENYELGTPENTKAKLDATPGQSSDEWQQQVDTMQKKNISMREALAKMWGVDEGHNPFEKKEGKQSNPDNFEPFKKKGKKEDKTMTGKPMTKIKVDPDMKEVKLGKKNVR